MVDRSYLYYCFMQGSGREWYGAFPDWGPLAEDSATKLKKGQLNVCNVQCVWCTLFPPVAEIYARLAGNFCQ